MGRAILLVFAIGAVGCGGERRPGTRPAEGPVPAPASLSAIVAVPSLDEGLRPLAELAEDLLPRVPSGGGRGLVVDWTGLGPDAEDRIDGSRPAFVLLYGPRDPAVWVLPLRGTGPIEAPPHGFARVRGETALVCESGALIDASADFAIRTLSRERPLAPSLRILGGPARAGRRRQLETMLSGLARDLEASAREARAAAAGPPTLGDPEAVGPLAEDLAREALAALPDDGEIEVRASADGTTVRLEVRAPAGRAPASGRALAPPRVEGAILGWSSVEGEEGRAAAARRTVAAFERIAGDRLDGALRAELAAAADRFARSRDDASAWSVAPDAVAAVFAAAPERRAEALEAARAIASACGRGHLRRVLGTLGLLPVAVTEEPEGVGLRLGSGAAGRGEAPDWSPGTTLAADLHLLRAVAALGALGGERAATVASLAGEAPSVPPAHLSVRQDDGRWQASLSVPRESARELGRVLRRALAN